MFDLTGKKALVTGAASGIGAAIAHKMAEAGAAVFLADLNLDGAAEQAQAIRATGASAEAHALNVTDFAACQALADAIGPMDILVNNAAIGAVGTLLTTPPEDMDKMYAVNVKGVYHVTKAFIPAMIERKSGNIINMASIGGLVGIRDRLAYTTTKFAVVGFTKAVALDHADARIRSNCICPARVETPFVQQRLAEYPDPEAARKEMTSTQLFGRMIHPDEIAAAAVYLASDESFMITGTEFKIDCGWTTGK